MKFRNVKIVTASSFKAVPNIRIYATKLTNPLRVDSDWLRSVLPDSDWEKIRRFKDPKDADRLVAGRLLLLHALDQCGSNHDLSDMYLSEFGRPMLSDSLDFNISHSGHLVVCGMHTAGKIGVDVEEMNPISVMDFKGCFTDAEWEVIQRTGSLEDFYNFWTMKEAAVKANGKGLSIDLKDVRIINPSVVWINGEEQRWSMVPLMLGENCVGHVAVSGPPATVDIEMVHADEFKYLIEKDYKSFV